MGMGLLIDFDAYLAILQLAILWESITNNSDGESEIKGFIFSYEWNNMILA